MQIFVAPYQTAPEFQDIVDAIVDYNIHIDLHIDGRWKRDQRYHGTAWVHRVVGEPHEGKPAQTMLVPYFDEMGEPTDITAMKMEMKLPWLGDVKQLQMVPIISMGPNAVVAMANDDSKEEREAIVDAFPVYRPAMHRLEPRFKHLHPPINEICLSYYRLTRGKFGLIRNEGTHPSGMPPFEQERRCIVEYRAKFVQYQIDNLRSTMKHCLEETLHFLKVKQFKNRH